MPAKNAGVPSDTPSGDSGDTTRMDIFLTRRELNVLRKAHSRLGHETMDQTIETLLRWGLPIIRTSLGGTQVAFRLFGEFYWEFSFTEKPRGSGGDATDRTFTVPTSVAQAVDVIGRYGYDKTSVLRMAIRLGNRAERTRRACYKPGGDKFIPMPPDE